jgi:hypothetical protein
MRCGLPVVNIIGRVWRHKAVLNPLHDARFQPKTCGTKPIPKGVHNVAFILTDEDKQGIRAFFVPKMQTMDEDAWAYWSMDQDGWEDDLFESMDPVRFLLFYWDCEDEGCWPTESVADYLAELEVEVYGRVVCE